ncbi:MAG TPA: hypothetical protein VIY48_09830, partial [Candidatus Paceibacterota bacterium]
VSWIGLIGVGICLLSMTLGAIVFCVGIAGLLTQAVYSVAFNNDPGSIPGIESAVFYCASGFVLGCMIVAPMLMLSEKSLRGPAQWRPYSLAGYLANHRPMPEAVKLGAKAICAAFSNAELTVLVLEQDNLVLDPVLEVVLVNPTTGKLEKAYPFVWDADGNILSPPQ